MHLRGDFYGQAHNRGNLLKIFGPSPVMYHHPRSCAPSPRRAAVGKLGSVWGTRGEIPTEPPPRSIPAFSAPC